MGLKTALSATFNACTIAANAISDGITACNGLVGILGDTVNDFQKSSQYEREKEQALERLKTDIYYAKQLKQLKAELQKNGIKDLSKIRAELADLQAKVKETKDEVSLEDIVI